MKPMLTAGAVAALLLSSTAVHAQGAAATLPNAFDGPATAQRPAIPPPAPSEAQAPDIARAEAALRSVITALHGGGLDYTAFTDDLATQLRQREATVTPMVRGYGPVQSVTFVGEQNGADLFSVVFANQRTLWLIGFDDQDRIAALLFRAVQADDEPEA